MIHYCVTHTPRLWVVSSGGLFNDKRWTTSSVRIERNYFIKKQKPTKNKKQFWQEKQIVSKTMQTKF